MTPLFKRFGIDSDQLKILVINAIRIDFRESRGIGIKRRKISPIVWSLIFYLIMGSSMAVGLVMKATPFFYAFLLLSYSMVMMAFVVILEFGHSLFAVDEADVLLHRPISSRTFFFSKMINLIFYVLLMGTALGFFPALIGMILPDTPWFFCFVYFGVALMANFFMASMVVLLYSVLLRWLPLERLKDTLVHVQIGISFLLIFSYQFIPRIGELQADKLDISSLWIYLLPSAWFTGVIQFVLGTPHVMNGGVTVLALAGTFFLGGFAFRRISSLYIQRVTDFSITEKNAEKKSFYDKTIQKFSIKQGGLESLLRHPDLIVGYKLTSWLLKSDRSIKMGLYPAFGIPLAIILFSIIEGRLTDPFIIHPFTDINNTSIMIPFFVLFLAHFFMLGIHYIKDWQAAWIYQATPLVSPGHFVQGVKLSIFIRLMLPFFIILFIIYCTQMTWIHGLKYVFTLFLVGLLAFSVFTSSTKHFPFSRKRERGERILKISFFFAILPFLGLIVLMQLMIYKHAALWWGFQGLLLLFLLVSEVIAIKRLNNVLSKSEYIF